MIIGKRYTDGSGYLFNDNRASGFGLQEVDVLSCNHCQRLLIGNSWKHDGGFCGQCGCPVCGPCADKIMKPLEEGGGCTPFVKRVEKQYEENIRRRQNEKILGIS